MKRAKLAAFEALVRLALFALLGVMAAGTLATGRGLALPPEDALAPRLELRFQVADHHSDHDDVVLEVEEDIDPDSDEQAHSGDEDTRNATPSAMHFRAVTASSAGPHASRRSQRPATEHIDGTTSARGPPTANV